MRLSFIRISSSDYRVFERTAHRIWESRIWRRRYLTDVTLGRSLSQEIYIIGNISYIRKVWLLEEDEKDGLQIYGFTSLLDLGKCMEEMPLAAIWGTWRKWLGIASIDLSKGICAWPTWIAFCDEPTGLWMRGMQWMLYVDLNMEKGGLRGSLLADCRITVWLGLEGTLQIVYF